jgi:transposase
VATLTPAEATVESLLQRIRVLEKLVESQAAEIRRLQEVLPQQVAEIQRLLALVAEQAAAIERLRSRGPSGKTPQNSSVPPSAATPPNRPAAAAKRRGPKKGHAGRSRRRCQPDQVLSRRPTLCRCCGASLSGVASHVRGRSQQVELPPVKPLVVEVVRYGCRCPHCGTKNAAALPLGWDPHQRFGPRLQALLSYLHHQQHVAYARLRQLLADLFGLSISEGAIAAALARCATALKAAHAAIREQVRGSPVVGSDETRQRVAGQNRWSWVVQSDRAAYHWVGESRGTKELLGFFDGVCPEVQGCDCFSAQLASPVSCKQVCMAHQLRDLKHAQEHGDEQYAPRMARLIRLAIRLAKRRSRFGERRYLHQAQRLQRLGHTLGWRLRVENPFGEAMQERYQRLERHWWVFLEREDVEPTNNASERALRPVVVHRKVNGGFRSEWGAEGYARFVSVVQTAQKQGQAILPSLLRILVSHPLPIPE